MRWILALVGAVALTSVCSPGPAWAGDDKESKVGAQDEFSTVIGGLDAELLERIVATLKEHHPAVHVRVKEGFLKLRAEDGKAFKDAMITLEKLGVPMGGPGDDLHLTEERAEAKQKAQLKRERPHEGQPSDKHFKQKIGAVERMLVAAREGGREREVAELEQALVGLRRMRHDVAAARAARADGKDDDDESADDDSDDHDSDEDGDDDDDRPDLARLRKRLERAKQAMREHGAKGEGRTPVEVMDIQRFLETLGHEIGAERKRHGPQGELKQRMEHTRQALKHLKEAGLPEHAQQVEHALHRMELAAEGQAREPAFIPGAPRRVIEVAPARQPVPAPGHVRPVRPVLVPQDCPPPSVGGVRRGPIQVRPRVLAPAPPLAGGVLVEPPRRAPVAVAPKPVEFVVERAAKVHVLDEPTPDSLRFKAGAGVRLRVPEGAPQPAPHAAPPPEMRRMIQELREQVEHLRKELHHVRREIEEQEKGAR